MSQAAYDRFGDNVEYAGKTTITGECLSDSKAHHGSITELTRSPFSFHVSHHRVSVGVPSCATRCGGSTLSDVYESVRSGECPIGLIPQENSIHGIVNEAYDSLRGPDAGKEVFVRGEVTIGIQHCLITRKGVALEDVKRVLSHEQVRMNSNLLCLCRAELTYRI